ncbi:nuclease PIN [Arthrobacter sp. UM1]|uniref:nuclease PIN n=1 Tax=Arthrobacter sp. UM1 TaxID=2766776 RepID=UPI001CF65990|nr:nuclease PIN [Arthrobacter sp. UM1]MCB4208846.1 nuclease PIN [Arthrobacter sp. UM1]
MKWRFRVPRESVGIDLLADMSRELASSVQTLAEMLGSEADEYPRLVEQMHATEGRSNELFFRLLTTMRSSIINRLPREDLYRMGEHINTAIECLDTASDILLTLNLHRQSPRAAELLEIIQRMADNSIKMFTGFENMDDLEDIWVDSLRLGKRAEHTRLTWLKEVLEAGSGPGSGLNAAKHTLMAERLMLVVGHLRELAMDVGEIVVRES